MSVLSAKRVIHKHVAMAQWKANLSKAIKISPENALLRLSEFYFQALPEFSHENIVQPSVDLQIIVPVYNVEKYLKECIQSILSQSTSFSYRVVFVDDGSTDHSGEILDKYKENPCIEVVHTKNGGLSKARIWHCEVLLGNTLCSWIRMMFLLRIQSKFLWKQLFYITRRS